MAQEGEEAKIAIALSAESVQRGASRPWTWRGRTPLLGPAQPPLLAYERIMDLPLMLGRVAQRCQLLRQVWQGMVEFQVRASEGRGTMEAGVDGLRWSGQEAKQLQKGGGKGKGEKGESPGQWIPPPFTMPPNFLRPWLSRLRCGHCRLPHRCSRRRKRGSWKEGVLQRDATGGEQPEETMVGAPRAHLEAVGDAEAGLQQEGPLAPLHSTSTMRRGLRANAELNCGSVWCNPLAGLMDSLFTFTLTWPQRSPTVDSQDPAEELQAGILVWPMPRIHFVLKVSGSSFGRSAIASGHLCGIKGMNLYA